MVAADSWIVTLCGFVIELSRDTLQCMRALSRLPVFVVCAFVVLLLLFVFCSCCCLYLYLLLLRLFVGD